MTSFSALSTALSALTAHRAALDVLTGAGLVPAPDEPPEPAPTEHGPVTAPDHRGTTP